MTNPPVIHPGTVTYFLTILSNCYGKLYLTCILAIFAIPAFAQQTPTRETFIDHPANTGLVPLRQGDSFLIRTSFIPGKSHSLLVNSIKILGAAAAGYQSERTAGDNGKGRPDASRMTALPPIGLGVMLSADKVFNSSRKKVFLSYSLYDKGNRLISSGFRQLYKKGQPLTLAGTAPADGYLRASLEDSKGNRMDNAGIVIDITPGGSPSTDLRKTDPRTLAIQPATPSVRSFTQPIALPDQLSTSLPAGLSSGSIPTTRMHPDMPRTRPAEPPALTTPALRRADPARMTIEPVIPAGHPLVRAPLAVHTDRALTGMMGTLPEKDPPASRPPFDLTDEVPKPVLPGNKSFLFQPDDFDDWDDSDDFDDGDDPVEDDDGEGFEPDGDEGGGFDAEDDSDDPPPCDPSDPEGDCYDPPCDPLDVTGGCYDPCAADPSSQDCLCSSDPSACENPCATDPTSQDCMTMCNKIGQLMAQSATVQAMGSFTPPAEITNLLSLYSQTPGEIITSPDTPPLPNNFSLQTLDNATGADVNADFYGIHISSLPPGMTPDQFLEAFRTNINDYTGDNATFSAYNYNGVDSSELYDSSGTDAVGALVHIDMTKDGTVVLSDYQQDMTFANGATGSYFTFSTVTSPEDAFHPVSGNRTFGIQTDPVNGGYTFYISGVDRATNDLSEIAGDLGAWNLASNLWTTVINNLTGAINDSGGSAATGTGSFTSMQTDYNNLQSFLDGSTNLGTEMDDLGCPEL